MAYFLDVEFVEGGEKGRLALYRHSLLKEAQASGNLLMLRAVGSGWDNVAKAPTQQTDVVPPVGLQLVDVTPSRLKLAIQDWPEEAPLGELMQFSVGDHGGELYLWARALGFRREETITRAAIDAKSV